MLLCRYSSALLAAVILTLIAPSIVRGSTLNVPRVLLPLFNDFAVNFTLKVEGGGCFKWTTSRSDVIQLTPVNELDNGCSSQAVVSAITKEAKRDTVIVFAEEVHSKQILPCDVIVDVIHSLSLITHTHELFVEEAPERFEAVAYDSEGNQFSTLEGVEMEWTVSPLSSSGGVSNVRLISFKNSPYETPPSVAHFDEIGVRGYICLLEGIKTGLARVSVRLPQKEYRNVQPKEVQLIVVANLIIDPADIYLMPGDSVKYRLLQVRQGRLHEIELPSQQYYLEVEDVSVASMDKLTSQAHGLKIGQTKVAVRDRNVSPSESGARVPTATLNVALPAFLHLTLLPFRNWAVLVDETHGIMVEVYDRSNHKFHGEHMMVRVSISPPYFHIESSTPNGTYHEGRGVEPGTARVEAVLEGVRAPDGTEYALEDLVTSYEDMLIYARMEILPQEVVFPWSPRSQARYEVKLKCQGGDGSFLWDSANISVATVTQAGVVSTLSTGQSTITASMMTNTRNKAFAVVHVLPPSRLQIIDYGLEAEIGAPVHLQIAIYGKQLNGSDLLPFTKCNQLPLRVVVWDENFVHDEKVLASPQGEACTTVAVFGKLLGTSKVTVSYQEGDVLLEDTVVVSAYRPLTVLHPARGETVLALGTSRVLVFTGGPRSWPGRSSEHGKNVTLGDGSKAKKDMVEVIEIADVSKDILDKYVYRALCRSIGETFVTLSVFNEAVSGHRVESQAKVRIFCANPRYATLRAMLQTEDNTSCPMNINADRIAVQSSHNLDLELRVSDVHGRTFDNITSILMEWTATPDTLSRFEAKAGVISKELHVDGLDLPDRHVQRVYPSGETGGVDITVRLTGYRSAVLRPQQITPEWPPFGVKNDKGVVTTPDIRASLGLLFVSDTLVTPNQATLFNHPKSKLILQVTQGSGYFQPQLDSQDVATVRYIEHSRTLEVQPRTTGVAQFGLLDLCLPSRPASVVVTVVSVRILVVDVADRLELKRRTLCRVHITDTMGNPLQLSDMSMLDLRPELDTTALSIISIKEYESDPKLDKELGITGPAAPGEFRYIIHGRSLGDATLVFTTGHGVYEVRSSPVSIQVFGPLHLYPRNVTILVGSQLLIGVSGGPSSGSLVEFSLAPAGYARISSVGVLEGERVGRTRLIAQAVGSSKLTGNKIIFSEDFIDVFVVPLTGIRIECPLSKIKVNSVVPVWVSGMPETVNTMVLGTTKPPLAFEWSLSSREVAELRDVLEGTGITVTNEHRTSMRVRAHLPGRTTLKVTVLVPSSMSGTPKNIQLEDELLLEVYEELRLIHPPSSSGLLIAPETEMHLRTNRDGVARVLYSLQGYPTTGSADSSMRDPSVLLNQQSPVLSLSPTGLLTTHTSPGRASIVVSSFDSSIRQTIGLSIEVKPVHYIMASVRSAFRISPGIGAKALPKGLELTVDVTYHDNTGAVFAATRTDITMHASRADLVQLGRATDLDFMSTNASLSVSLVHPGATVLRISDELTPTLAADFIKLPVQEFIFPTEAEITVGDMICFSMPLETHSGEMGHWSTENSEVLTVEHDTGLGHARSPGGPVIIKYHLAGHVVSSTEVAVVPIDSMMFVKIPDSRLLNHDKGTEKAFRVGLILSGRQEENKLNNLLTRSRSQTCLQSTRTIHPSFPFTCEARFNSHGITIKIQDVFSIHPIFDPAAGLYACELVSTGIMSSEISRLQTNVTLRARALSWAGGATSVPLVLPFLPLLFLPNQGVIISGGAPGQLEIVAVPEVLAQIQVHPLGEGMVDVSEPEQKSETVVVYQVVLTNKFWTQAAVSDQQYVRIISALTEQDVKVPLKLLQVDHCVISPAGSLVDMAYSHRHSLMIVVSVISIALGTVYVYAAFIQPAFHAPNYAFLQSSPGHSQPSGYQSFVASSPLGSPVSPNLSSSLNRSTAFSDTEPVYGDPRLYYDSPRARNMRSLR